MEAPIWQKRRVSGNNDPGSIEPGKIVVGRKNPNTESVRSVDRKIRDGELRSTPIEARFIE